MFCVFYRRPLRSSHSFHISGRRLVTCSVRLSGRLLHLCVSRFWSCDEIRCIVVRFCSTIVWLFCAGCYRSFCLSEPINFCVQIRIFAVTASNSALNSSASVIDLSLRCLRKRQHGPNSNRSVLHSSCSW